MLPSDHTAGIESLCLPAHYTVKPDIAWQQLDQRWTQTKIFWNYCEPGNEILYFKTC